MNVVQVFECTIYPNQRFYQSISFEPWRLLYVKPCDEAELIARGWHYIQASGEDDLET